MQVLYLLSYVGLTLASYRRSAPGSPELSDRLRGPNRDCDFSLRGSAEDRGAVAPRGSACREKPLSDARALPMRCYTRTR